MAFREQNKTVYRSMQGKEVDMNKLVNQNEMTVAVGNVRVNARGDLLGPGGKIVKKYEESVRETSGSTSIPSQRTVRKPVDEDPTGGV
jgi:hypothetical protein